MTRITRSQVRVLCALAASALAGIPARADSPAVRALSTRFTYKASVPETPRGTKALDLWIPIPSDNPYQTIGEVNVDCPGTHRITRESKFGNRMVYVRVDNPSGPTTVTVHVDVNRREVAILGGDPSLLNDPPAKYLAPDSRVPLGGRYGEIAKEVAGDKATPLEKVRALYDHVVATMQYDYKKESPKLGEGDVAFVCDYKKGNCSDLHSYLISLARSLGISAYLEYGFPLTGIPVADPMPKEGNIAGYHCWTWFHMPDKGWVVLDASDGRRWLDSKRADIKERLFGNLVLERSAVAFSRGRDINLVPRQKGEPLNNFIYPYAEADGNAVKTAWEVRYALLGTNSNRTSDTTIPGAAAGQAGANSDLQRQIDELRQLVMAQAKEIAALKQGREEKPTEKKPAPVPVTAPSRETLSAYGFIRVDAIVDSGQTNNAQTPFFVNSPSNANVASRGNTQSTMHPRLSRLGFNLAAPPDTLKGTKVSGKVEWDWQNGQGLTSESRPLPRARHAYIQLQRGPSTWLFGQTSDLISPLYPSPNDDTLQWNAGNLGDRRPQIRYVHETTGSPINIGLALGLSGALDSKDLDANTVRDGEDSGLPNVQLRTGYKRGQTGFGLWGHWARENSTKPVAGRKEWDSFSVGLDLEHRFARKWDLRGELWTGQDLSDFRGGIAQGVNAATGNEIRSRGGWLELGYQTTASHRMAVGYTIDDPLDRDIPAGGRLKNYSLYLHNRWRLPGNLEFGANYLYWLTKWNGLATGIDNRFSAFIQHNF